MYVVDDIWRGALVSEVVPYADYTFNVSIESQAKLFGSHVWNISFAVVNDSGVKNFCGCIFVSVGVYVEVC